MKRLLFPERPQKNTWLREWVGPLTNGLALKSSAPSLPRVPESVSAEGAIESVCGYCSTGCSLKIHLKNGEPVNVSADLDYPVNQGMACPKGWEAMRVLDSHDRALEPLLRNENGSLNPVSWDSAMWAFSNSFQQIQAKHGPDSLAWLGTGQITVEELAFLGSLGRFGMGIRHGDGNTRQCMATAAVAYKESFGFDAPPYTYQDFEESDALIFVGANPCIAHPIMWQRVMRNRNRPDIVVIDPRKTETAMVATQHCPISPKSDLVLFYGLARELIQRGAIDKAYIDQSVEGFDEFKAFVQDFTIEASLKATGLSRMAFHRLVGTIENGKRVSFWWTMGVNQSHEGVRLAQAIINLALITGNIGRPGTGANSITGQCNAMGSRLFSNTSSLIGGYEFCEPDHRRHVASVLDVDEDQVPSSPGWAYDQIIDKIEEGVIKGLWVVATNSAHSWIGHDRVKRAFEKLEFLVVQDMYTTTETAQMADLILPAAGWGEKEGVFINSERRIGRTRRARKSPGLALSDFNIFRLVARYWNEAKVFRNWDSPETVFKLLTRLTKGRPCDISGIESYAMLEEQGGIQWPYRANETDTSTQRRLFSDGRFYRTNRKAKLIFEAPRPTQEISDKDYPFILLTGRGTSAQWHTGTRTSKSDVLRKMYPKDIYFEMNPEDANRLHLVSGSQAKITSRRASLIAKVMVTATVREGQIFLPMHYAEANRLTCPSYDPYSRQPSYKHSAVSITPHHEN